MTSDPCVPEMEKFPPILFAACLCCEVFRWFSKAIRPLDPYISSQLHKTHRACPGASIFRRCCPNLSPSVSVSNQVHLHLFFTLESSNFSPRCTTRRSAILPRMLSNGHFRRKRAKCGLKRKGSSGLRRVVITADLFIFLYFFFKGGIFFFFF